MLTKKEFNELLISIKNKEIIFLSVKSYFIQSVEIIDSYLLFDTMYTLKVDYNEYMKDYTKNKNLSHIRYINDLYSKNNRKLNIKRYLNQKII